MALGAVRLGVDKAGGKLFFTQNQSVFAEGFPVVLKDGLVKPHNPKSIHTAIHSMVAGSGSGSIFCTGLSVLRQSDTATCGHSATGSSTVFFN